MDNKSEKHSVEAEKPEVDLDISLDLNSNVEARLKNPLAGIPRDQLIRNVEHFAKEKELTHIIPVLTKGALRKFAQCCIVALAHVTT
jgi:hypothetical protein